MSLFQWGNFTLHSGMQTWWRIDCDNLTNSEIHLLAKLIAEKVGTYHEVSCPESHPGSAVHGLKAALLQYREPRYAGKKIMLLVDDVLTSGATMQHIKDLNNKYYEYKGAVIFARGLCPDWVTPIFQM